MIPSLKETLSQLNSDYLQKLNNELDLLEDVRDLIENSIYPEPPISVKEGNIIRTGYNEEVDYYRGINVSGKDFILNLENAEKEKTGIKSLKIKFNKVFGYYIEVTKTNLDLVPENYIRKQTLANAERYYTEELKEIEDKILNAEEKVIDLEYEVFQVIRKTVLESVQRIKKSAEIISITDVLFSFAKISYENNYVMPVVHSGDEILIYEGRHPVVENMMDKKDFVPNSVSLDCRDNRMLLITGPNMAGKSTFIRQVAIITLMAQIGCYVPAEKAKIGVVDRIFTRVGASDDLALGQSTFMVEMSEVSNILKNATSNSLIILDEIGRGTSTFDGLSIAWSVAEYIHDKEIIGAKALFATHYHELTQLETLLEGVKNYCIKVQENEEGVIFLRKIIPGSADQSYGIEVAKLAGLPQQVIFRAREILMDLESSEDAKVPPRKTKELQHSKEEVNLFNYQDKQIIEDLKALPIEDMSPIEVMNYVYNLRKKMN